jgi:hypothetical protein
VRALAEVAGLQLMTAREAVAALSPTVRAGRAALPLQDRRRGHQNGQRYRIRARRLYFYSRDIGRIWRVAEGLEYGIVGIDEGIISTEIAPFGGMKESGIGPIWGSLGLEIRHRGIPRCQYLCMGGIDR